MNNTDVPGTLREMWQTRPARPRDDRQVAGVASAIARRYDIDPVLVRIGFVVAAVFGIGAALYIAGWIVLPETPADPAAPAPRRSPRPIAVIALTIAVVVGIGSVFSDRGHVLLPALVVAALLFLLHRSRGHRTVAPVPPVPPPVPPADGPTVASAAATGPSLVKETAPTPPAWDPLGAAPFAWDLPEPSPVPVPDPARSRRWPVTRVTIGVALLAVAATAVLTALVGGLGVTDVPLLFGVALAVIGTGLVVGAFLHSGRGLIPLALLVAALTWGAVAAPLDRVPNGGFGDITVTPATPAELLPSYQRTGGDISLDLRRFDLTGTDATAVRTAVSLGGGDITVWVPPDADVTLHGSAGIGEVSLGDREVSGPGSRLDVVADPGADGVRSGRELVLDLSTGAGDVEVRRG